MKIIAVAQNYFPYNKTREEALLNAENPMIFMKPDSALLVNNKPFFIPNELGVIEYETEIVVRICRLGKTIPERFAHRYYDAITVGIDFTARELLGKFRAEGRPWELCKGFDGSAVLGEWVDKKSLTDLENIDFKLDINGRTVQSGSTANMIHTTDKLVSYVSRFFTLKTGDLIYTGCPVEGWGRVNIDDHLEGYLNDMKVLEFNCK